MGANNTYQGVPMGTVHSLAEARDPKGGPVSDAALVEMALDGRESALDTLYRRHAAAVGGLSARLLGSRQDVDDVVHDAFIEAFGKLGSLRNAGAFRAWILQIAVSRVRSVLRRNKRSAFIGSRNESPGEECSLERLAGDEVSPELRAELALLGDVLRRLPTNQRIAWMLREVEGYRLAEIAQMCGCSLSTAKRRIAAATKRLRAHGLEDVGR